MINMKTIQFAQYKCEVIIQKYMNQRPSISLIDVLDKTPILTASINMPEIPLEKGEVIIKDYSENQGILDTLIKEGYIEKTGKSVLAGHAECQICKLIM